MDQGVIKFIKKNNGIDYDTFAKCICPSSNKYNSIACITEVGFDIKTIANENVEKHNLTVTKDGCIKNKVFSIDVEEAKQMCREMKFENLNKIEF